LLCCVAIVAGVVAEADADALLRDALARALEANERLARLAEELREELARRDAELERVNAELAVLQRLPFGRSSERARPEAASRDEDGGGDAGRDRGAAVRAAGRAGRGAGGAAELLASAPGRGGLRSVRPATGICAVRAGR
jgi:transposase